MKFFKSYRVFEVKSLKNCNVKNNNSFRNGMQAKPEDYDKYKYVYRVGDGAELRRCVNWFANDNRFLPSKDYYDYVIDEDHDKAEKDWQKDLENVLIKIGYDPKTCFSLLGYTDYIEVLNMLDFIKENIYYYFRGNKNDESHALIKSKFYKKHAAEILKVLIEDGSIIEEINPDYFSDDNFINELIKKDNSLYKLIYPYVSQNVQNKWKHLGIKFGFFD